MSMNTMGASKAYDSGFEVIMFGNLILLLSLIGYFWISGTYIIVITVFAWFLARTPLMVFARSSSLGFSLEYRDAIVLFMVFAITKLYMHDFVLWIGDASAYQLDANQTLSVGRDVGFFPPVSAAISGVSAFFLGVSGGAWAHVGFYIVVLLLMYVFLRDKIRLTRSSLLLVLLLFIVNPLSIWFTKSNFSEPLWHFVALALLYGLVRLYEDDEDDDSRKYWLFIVAITLFLAPLVRGTAIFAMSFVYFSVFFLASRKARITNDLIVLSLSFMLGILLALELRTGYYIGWQLSRIIPDLSIMGWRGFFVGVLTAGVLFAALMQWFIRKKSHSLDFNGKIWVVTPVILLFLIKGVVGFISTDNYSIINVLFANEWSFLNNTFGSVFAFVVILGFAYSVWLCAKGDRIALIVLSYYVFMSLPLMFSGLHPHNHHDLYLYWSRYYFSDILIAHLLFFGFAIAWVDRVVLGNGLFKITKIHAVALILLLVGFVYEKGADVRAVIMEANMPGSNYYVSEIVRALGDKSVHVIYDENVRYGGYNGAQFIGRSLARLGVNIKSEHITSLLSEKAIESVVNTDEPITLYKNYILCVSSKMSGCNLDSLFSKPEHQFSGLFPYLSQVSSQLKNNQRNMVLGVDVYSFGNDFVSYTDGWYKAEHWGRWSKGRKSTVSVALPSWLANHCDKIRVRGQTFIPAGKESYLTVASDQFKKDILILNNSKIMVDVPINKQDVTIIDFTYSDNYKISDYINSKDSRETVFGLNDLELVGCSMK